MTKTTRRQIKTTSSQTSGNNQMTIIVGAILIGVVGLGLLLYLSLREPPPITGVIIHGRPSRGHDAEAIIPTGVVPPVGGTHHPQWQNCGIYDEFVEAKHVIHSMEHGAVWITYNEQLADGDIATLEGVVRDNDSFIILSPYPGQTSPLVLTAWGVQLELESASDRRVEQFVERYRLGTQTPERGAACSGGLGEPRQ